MDWRIAHVVRGAGVPAGAPHSWGGAAVAAGGCLRFCAADADFPAAGSTIQAAGLAAGMAQGLPSQLLCKLWLLLQWLAAPEP